MASGSELELRRLVAEGLTSVNIVNGGRHLSAVARTIGVDRTTVTRWLKAETTASVDHCRALAEHYPDYFSEGQLLELHAAAALGRPPDRRALTVGAQVLNPATALHREAADAMLVEPGSPRNRVILLAALHLDAVGMDVEESGDPMLDDGMVAEVRRFRAAMAMRAAEGWKVRVVVITTNRTRLETLRRMVEALDGPDVEIRAYPLSVPLTLSVLVTANRDVFLSYDHRRWERPESALVLRSAPIVQWAGDYFDQLYADAPFTIRGVEGPRWDQFDALCALAG